MKYARDAMQDYASTRTGKQKREDWASDLIWFLIWLACAAPLLTLFFVEGTR